MTSFSSVYRLLRKALHNAPQPTGLPAGDATVEYCMGGGSEMALCAGLVVASDNARIGMPFSRVWGCRLSGMWVYRRGPAKAKCYALNSEWVSGEETARAEMINQSVALEDSDETGIELAEKLAKIPLAQLMSRRGWVQPNPFASR